MITTLYNLVYKLYGGDTLIYLLSLFTADFKVGLVLFFIEELVVFVPLGILLTLIVIFTNHVNKIANVWLIMAYCVFKVYEIILIVLNFSFWTMHI